MSENSDFRPSGSVFTGRKMAFTILGFFGVVIAANATLTVFALKNWPGLVVQNSYVASQNFNRDVAAMQAQPAAGWAIEARAEPGGLAALTLRDAQGAPLTGLAVSALAVRPTRVADDTALGFTHRGGGVYGAERALAPGAWRLVLTLEDPFHGPQTRSVDLVVRGGS